MASDLIDRIRDYLDNWPEPCEVAAYILREALAELERHRWIPVAERLPTPINAVWVVASGVVREAWQDQGRWYRGWSTPIDGVTHWRERPVPPEELPLTGRSESA